MTATRTSWSVRWNTGGPTIGPRVTPLSTTAVKAAWRRHGYHPRQSDVCGYRSIGTGNAYYAPGFSLGKGSRTHRSIARFTVFSQERDLSRPLTVFNQERDLSRPLTDFSQERDWSRPRRRSRPGWPIVVSWCNRLMHQVFVVRDAGRSGMRRVGCARARMLAVSCALLVSATAAAADDPYRKANTEGGADRV